MKLVEMEEIVEEIGNLKKNGNKFQRKKIWEKIFQTLDANENLPNPDFFSQIHLSLFRGLEDEGERCREFSASSILKFFLNPDLSLNQCQVHLLFPILAKKFDRMVNSYESSEETRLILAQLLLEVARKCSRDDELNQFGDELVLVLKSGLEDSFHEVKIVTGEVIKLLDQNCRKTLMFFAANLSGSVLKNFCHQQKKVRLSSVQVLGVIVKLSQSQTFVSCVPHLIQKHFDICPQVRLATSLLAGQLLTDWPYRRENLAFLIPLILPGLEDEIESNVVETRRAWDIAGQQWLEEESKNDKRIKDLADFGDEQASHYPAGITRPNLGCRLMVSRLVFKLKDAVHRDIKDWLLETRLKTVQLLKQLIIHSEQEMIGHAESMMNIFYDGVRDAEPQMVSKIMESVFIFAHFIPPQTWTMLVLSRLSGNPSPYELKILAKLIAGSSPDLSKGHLEDLALVLQSSEICHTRSEEQLAEVLNCVLALLEVYDSHCKELEPFLFKSVITVKALAQGKNLQLRAEDALNTLQSKLDYQTRWEFFKYQMGPLLKDMQNSCNDWQPQSYDAIVFCTLLLHSGQASGIYIDQIFSILDTVINQADGTPDLKIQMFLVLAKQLMNNKNTLDSQGNFDAYSHKLVTELILPHLKWHAGKKFQAERTAALSCLWSLLDSRSLSSAKVQDLCQDVLPRLNALVEDDAERVRSLALKSFRCVFDIVHQDMPFAYLEKCCSIIVKRVDDVSDDIRLSCLQTLNSLPNCMGKKDSCQNVEAKEKLIQSVFKVLVVHMGDKDEKIKNSVYETLKILSQINPDGLKKELEFSKKLSETNITKLCL